MPAPDLPAVKAYLGDSSTYADPDVAAALAAELAAQARVCRVPAAEAEWPADLTEAVKRRVSRNLYMKGLPSGLETAVSETSVAAVRVGTTDPEVRRLEGPYRKRVVG